MEIIKKKVLSGVAPWLYKHILGIKNETKRLTVNWPNTEIHSDKNYIKEVNQIDQNSENGFVCRQ